MFTKPIFICKMNEIVSTFEVTCEHVLTVNVHRNGTDSNVIVDSDLLR